jgi:hypothetical protein
MALLLQLEREMENILVETMTIYSINSVVTGCCLCKKRN